MYMKVLEILQTPELGDQLKLIQEELEVLEGTARGRQATSAIRKSLPSETLGETMRTDIKKLIDDLFWAQQCCLLNANQRDLKALLDHDPDLCYVRAYQAMRPVAEDAAGLTLQLLPAGALLSKIDPQHTERPIVRSYLSYCDDSLAAALVLVNAELQIRWAAEAKVVGRHRMPGADDHSAIARALQDLRNLTAVELEELKCGHLPTALQSEVSRHQALAQLQERPSAVTAQSKPHSPKSEFDELFRTVPTSGEATA